MRPENTHYPKFRCEFAGANSHRSMYGADFDK
jgi:hypothetical protein